VGFPVTLSVAVRHIECLAREREGELVGKVYYEVERRGFAGPYILLPDLVARLDEVHGVYILSDKLRGIFVARYVGRAVDLCDRLGDHAAEGTYAYFFVKQTKTEIGAYWAECSLFHQYGKATHLDNRIHPARPAGVNLPRCSETGCKGEAF